MITFAIGFSALLIVTVVLGFIDPLPKTRREYIVAGRTLSPFIVGISAGATGNSSFIITGAVLLGYLFGPTFVFLPLAWLVGDLWFWTKYAGRVNYVARAANSYSAIDLLVPDERRLVRIGFGLLVGAALVFYSASQLAALGTMGSRFFGGSSGLWIALFAIFIWGYSAFGGIRASAKTDIFQAFLMIALLVVSLLCALLAPREIPSTPGVTIPFASTPFFVTGSPIKMWPAVAIGCFFLTWGMAGFGFSLSQPQMLTRIYAAKDPASLRMATVWYMFFLQGTWIGFTVLGILLRKFQQPVTASEGILFTYIQTHFHGLWGGLLCGGCFAVVASTLDSILTSVGALFRSGRTDSQSVALDIVAGAALVALSGVLAWRSELSIFRLSAYAVTFLTAFLAPPMLFRVARGFVSQKGLLWASATSVAMYVLFPLAKLTSFCDPYFPNFEMVPAIAASLGVLVICEKPWRTGRANDAPIQSREVGTFHNSGTG